MFKIYTILISAALLMSGCSVVKDKKNKNMNTGPVNVTTIKAETKSVLDEKKVIGLAQAGKIVEIRSRVDGFIEKEFVKDFQEVKAGDNLYSIENQQIKANIKADEALIFKTKTDFMNAKANLARYQSLFETKSASKAELETAKSVYAKAKSDFMAAEASLEKNKLLFSYSNIVAPISGTIDSHKYEVGSFVNQSNNLLTIIYNTKDMIIDIKLPEADSKVASQLQFFANNQPLVFESCSPTADINTKLISCRLNLKNSTGIKNNENIEVKYTINASKLLIPQKSLTQYKTGKAVYLITGKDEFKPVNVEVGDWYGSDIEIVSGIKAGDSVIYDGISQVKPDGKIKIEGK